MSQEKLIDTYIKRLTNEVTELLKSKILVESKLQYQEEMNAELSNKIKELEVQIEVDKAQQESVHNTF